MLPFFNKWENTGLLEGLGSEPKRTEWHVCLKTKRKSFSVRHPSMAGGDVEGFAAVAFPIVRRVFGGLIANDLRQRSANEPSIGSYFLP